MIIKRTFFGLIFFLCLLFVIVLQQSPNYYAYYKTPAGFFYTGQASWFDPWDINAYAGAIKEGQMGHILLKNIYTTDSHKAALFYPAYMLVGYLFRSFNPFLLFHVYAILAGAVLFILLYKLSQFFVKDRRYALFITVTSSVGGGIGWLFYPAIQSADLAITGFTFQSAFQRPHEALGMLLYLSSLCLFFKYVKNKDTKKAQISLLCMMLLVLFYPYYLLSYIFICASFIYFLPDAGKKQSQYKILGIHSIILALTTIIYYLHLLSTGFSSVVSQSLSHPPVLSLILGYGLFFPLFIYQFFLLKHNRPERLFLVIWILISLILSFLPTGIARFYLRGLFFPLSILLALTIKESKKQVVRSVLTIIIICILVWPSSFYILYRRIEETNRVNAWYYQSKEVNDIFTILQKSSKDGVLSGYTISNLLPSLTGKHVYFGHYIQTPHAEDRIKDVTIFYEGHATNVEAYKFLNTNKINYVVYGSEEKKMGKFNYPFLKPLYKSTEATLYEVK